MKKLKLDVFHPDRIANRILGMGDVVSLVEKAAQDLDEEKIKKTEENLKIRIFFYGRLFKST